MGLILKPFLGIAVNAAVLYGLLHFVPEITYSGGWMFFVVGGAVLGLINSIVKPILRIFAMPIIFLTGGLILVIINIGVLWFLEYFFEVIKFQDLAIHFPNLGSYIIGAIVFGLINWLLHLFD